MSFPRRRLLGCWLTYNLLVRVAFGFFQHFSTIQVPTKPALNERLSPRDVGHRYDWKLFSSTQAAPTRRRLHKDVVIVGGGLAGLSAALYLSQMDPDRHITILDRENAMYKNADKSVASFAAAGMLAPQSERLPKGDYLDLCMASKRMYPEFADFVESMAREAGEEGEPYLWSKTQDDGLDPWNIGYVASGGFLAPAFSGDVVATWAPPEDSGTATWLDEIQVRELEPSLHPDVVGGWWFPEDASVDARRLTCSLRAACVGAGVEFLHGEKYEVSSLDLADGKCEGIWLKSGKYFKTKSLLIANGSWIRNLLPVPIEPHKGQSLSLRMPKNQPPILRRVLFAQDSYIVPKADGRIIIGATVEAGSYDPHVTPAGILHILEHALQLLPGLAELPIEETWAGLRPTTPDKGPILGETPWENLFIAGGYWRNGVLLAPKTGELLASKIAGIELSSEDERLLEAFKWDRFTSKEGGSKIAADARYAASMYPIHRRKSGTGVAASVGTELGSYSTATSARDERAKDRQALWGDGSGDDAFEKAASLGQKDGKVFTFGEDISKRSKENKELPALQESASRTFPMGGEDTSDAYTVGFASNDEETVSSMTDIYETIKKNKSQQTLDMNTEEEPDQRPDPGFRIFFKDEESGKDIEVPPYTSPGVFLDSLGQKKRQQSNTSTIRQSSRNSATASDANSNNEQTYDGYQDIIGSNANQDREAELDAMRKARMANRADADSGLDLRDFFTPSPTENKNEQKVGIESSSSSTAGRGFGKPKTKTKRKEPKQSSTSDLSSVYDQIKQQKAASKIERDTETPVEEKPDPGFRVYYQDEETGDELEVPPYTSPGDFLASFEKQKKGPASGEVVNGNTREDFNAMEQPSVVNGVSSSADEESSSYSEQTFDGYQDIIGSNANQDREKELEAMRKARQQNRLGQRAIDEDDLNLL